MILRARIVLPIETPAIQNGAVAISGGKIRAVGRWRDLSTRNGGQKIYLGEVILMPGLVNAHCHLDYTHMAGQFPPPRSFIDWLKVITTTKAQWSAAEYRASWLSGAEMLLRTGITTVADIEAVPQLLPHVWDSTPLRIISLLEMIGITARRPADQVLKETLDLIETLSHKRCVVGLSPHAPYSTVPRLLQMTADVARRRDWLVCTHVAESKTEFSMFAQGRGEMFDWLQRSGREMSDCGLGSPVQHLERYGVLRHNLLATHANYLARGDAKLLARRRVSVVHCPRSHAYFKHEPFQLRRLLRAGVSVCLGTDSLASVLKSRRQTVELDMFSEMRVLSERQPWLRPKTIVAMATMNGARALARQNIGRLRPGAAADLIALRYAGKTSKAFEGVLQHQGNVNASVIGGHWAIPSS